MEDKFTGELSALAKSHIDGEHAKAAFVIAATVGDGGVSLSSVIQGEVNVAETFAALKGLQRAFLETEGVLIKGMVKGLAEETNTPMQAEIQDVLDDIATKWEKGEKG